MAAKHSGVIGRASKTAALLSGLATLALAVLISFDVLMRYFFNRPQLLVDEVAPFLLLLVIFGAAAQTFRVGGHVRVDLVTAHIRPAARAWFRAVNLSIGIAFLSVVIWVTTQSALTAFRYGRVSAVMLYPLETCSALAVGYVLLGPTAAAIRALRARGAKQDGAS